MYTSIALVALTGSLVASAASPSESLTWHEYAHARKMAQTEKKPVAVFIGNGATGYDKVCKDSKLSSELEKMLAENYLCVYVDVSTDAGKKLAEDFAVKGGMGLILSDRTGGMQAFFHDGDLSTADLTTWVKHFADPSVVVTTTKTVTSSRLSMYPSDSSGMGMMGNAGQVIYGSYPMYGSSYPGSYQGYSGFSSGRVMFGGGGCPGGNCPR